jgi:iron complex outermembrane recepter protein
MQGIKARSIRCLPAPVMKARWALMLAGVLGTSLYAPLSGAQQQQAPAASSDTESLGEVIVTARRQSERLVDVPISITVDTGQELTIAGVEDMRDLYVAVPGLAISTQGAYFQPSLRGISGNLVQVGAANPVAVYIDGIYQPNLLGNLFDLPDVERIETLKGPQGTLFGRNASAGAISVYTKDPSFTPSLTVSGGDGVYFGNDVHTSNDYTAKIDATGPLIDNKLAASVSGYYDDVPGYLTNQQTGQGTGLIQSYVYRGKLLFTPTDNLKILLMGFHSQNNDNADTPYEPYQGLTVGKLYPGAVVPSLPWHAASELRNGVSPVSISQTGESLRVEYNLGNLGTLTSLTGFTIVRTIYMQDVDGTYSPACVAVFACITPYLVKYGPDDTFQQELTYNSPKLGPTSFVAGIFYYHDWADYGTEVNPPLTPGGVLTGAQAGYFTKANDTTKAFAVYGEANTDITSALHLITGIRYSYEKQVAYGAIDTGAAQDIGGQPSWNAWTPRASLRYDTTANSDVYFTFSEGFKSGVIDTISLTQAVAQPEKLYSYEVGAKYGSSNFSGDVAFFYYDYRNQQVQFLNPDAATLIGNAAKSTLYGLDFDGTARLADGFQVRIGGSWLPHAVYNTLNNAIDYSVPLTPAGLQQVVFNASGSRMLRAPVFTGNLTPTYTRDTDAGRFDSSLIIYTSSEFFYDYLHTMKSVGYVSFGTNIGFKPTGTNFRFSVWGKNLTNRIHVEGNTLSGEADIVEYSPPREVGITAEYKF